MGDRYKYGETAQLYTKVYDATTGQLVNPSELVLTVYDITGASVLTRSLSGGSVVLDAIGQFHANITTGASANLTSRGFYSYSWVATGAVGLTSDWFDVVDTTPGLISLADARAELRKARTEDDDELARFVDAVNGWAEQTCGAIIPRSVTESVTARRGLVQLSVTPVLSLTSATANAVAVDVSGWQLEASSGLVGNQAAVPNLPWFTWDLARWGGGSTLTGVYSVTYLAGRSPVPPDLVRGSRRLLKHLWEVMRPQSGAPRLGGGGDDNSQTIPYLGFAVPHQVAEMVAPYVKLPGLA